MSCADPSCGAPKGRGRPRTGWHKVDGIFDGEYARESRWYCSWRCLAAAAAQEATKEKVSAGEALSLFD